MYLIDQAPKAVRIDYMQPLTDLRWDSSASRLARHKHERLQFEGPNPKAQTEGPKSKGERGTEYRFTVAQRHTSLRD